MTTPSSPVDIIAKAMEGVTPYAHEYAANNGDGTYSVIIQRGPPKRPVADWPIKPLYDAQVVLALARQAEAMEREMAELRRIGDGMSNVIHHWKQQSTIRESDRKLMAELQEQWDAVPRALIGGGNATD